MPASSDTVDSEGRQMKHFQIKYKKTKKSNAKVNFLPLGNAQTILVATAIAFF
jgi:hypothetical protein